MKFAMQARKFVATLVSISMLSLTLMSSLSHAAMVSTEQTLAEARQELLREDIQSRIHSAEAAEVLKSLGVSPEMVEQRVANMTDAELAAFNAEWEEMPAGETSAIGIVLFIFVVLIVLDLLGTTNIFPVIKPINTY